jgi:hypothetical protein
MAMRKTEENRSGSRRWRLQFGLRAMFVVTTVLAVLCSAVYRLPEKLAVIASLCLLVSVPVVLTVVLIHGRGYARTFSVGAMFPAGLSFLSLLLSQYGFDAIVLDAINEFLDWNDYRLILSVFLGVYSFVVVGNGLLAVAVHWALDRGREQDQREPQSAETEQ